uniref:RGS domain-containing protein n=1 Tax=Periophthalmus magnuspinnatus TaxID=409849 RepID=A0A3B4B0J6_9GOBI
MQNQTNGIILYLSFLDGKAAFFIFLKSEFCEENIEFWSKCEEYRTLKSKEDLEARANIIYEEYVCCEAPKEINLDYQTRNAITVGLDNPSTTLFLQAQSKVYSLMENNSYPRFLHSVLVILAYLIRGIILPTTEV